MNCIVARNSGYDDVFVYNFFNKGKITLRNLTSVELKSVGISFIIVDIVDRTSMSSNLLFVPYRKTQRIEFGKELREIISKEYYQTATVFEADLQEIDTLRNDTIDLEVSAQDLALLKRYV